MMSTVVRCRSYARNDARGGRGEGRGQLRNDREGPVFRSIRRSHDPCNGQFHTRSLTRKSAVGLAAKVRSAGCRLMRCVSWRGRVNRCASPGFPELSDAAQPHMGSLAPGFDSTCFETVVQLLSVMTPLIGHANGNLSQSLSGAPHTLRVAAAKGWLQEQRRLLDARR